VRGAAGGLVTRAVRRPLTSTRRSSGRKARESARLAPRLVTSGPQRFALGSDARSQSVAGSARVIPGVPPGGVATEAGDRYAIRTLSEVHDVDRGLPRGRASWVKARGPNAESAPGAPAPQPCRSPRHRSLSVRGSEGPMPRFAQSGIAWGATRSSRGMPRSPAAAPIRFRCPCSMCVVVVR